MLTVWHRLFIFLIPVALLSLYSQPHKIARALDMDTLPSPFTISIDGASIAERSSSSDDQMQAELGSPAAVFTLRDSRLTCGNWLLARNMSEDRSMLPKKVLWFPADSTAHVQPVTARNEGDMYHILFGSTSTYYLMTHFAYTIRQKSDCKGGQCFCRDYGW